jgi:hypothetical protein
MIHLFEENDYMSIQLSLRVSMRHKLRSCTNLRDPETFAHSVRRVPSSDLTGRPGDLADLI